MKGDTMNRTIRLFDEDSHRTAFEATVLSCELVTAECIHSAAESKPSAAPDTPPRYAVILDRTVFFPEGGGQRADPGTLGGFPVTDVQIDAAGVITHTVGGALTVGSTVTGCIDGAVRFSRMQAHSAEHIISGIVHRTYGYRNVGFHLGSEDVTLDFDGTLTREQLDEIEDEANRIITSCVPVRAYYPSPEALADMSYRSKLELTENVRIVEIGDPDAPLDRCACCAPHVSNTGEIGLVKLLDFMRYKGGVRIHLLAGMSALADYRRRYTAVATIAATLSVKQNDVLVGFDRLRAEVEEKRQTITSLSIRLQDMTVDALAPTDGSIFLFDGGLDALGMRQILNRAVKKCGRLCGMFSGNDTDGYTYVIGRGSAALDLKKYIQTVNTALHARGGGSSDMLQGRATASRSEIQAFFASFEP